MNKYVNCKKRGNALIKILLFLMVCAVLFLPACDGSTQNNENNSQNTADAEIARNGDIPNVPDEPESGHKSDTDDLPDTDMNGYIFRMYTRDVDWISGNMDVEEVNGDTVNDAVYTRNRIIEARFNMLFSEVTANNTDAARATISAGDDAYDMISTRCVEAYQYAQRGLLYSVSHLQYVDLTKNYWYESLNDTLTVGNKRYFAVGASTPTLNDFTGCLLFNKDMFTDLGLEFPYELVSSGKWTFDRFRELAKMGIKDINGDGIMDENDSFGYVSDPRYVLPSFWVSSGNLSIKKDDSDIPYFAIPGNERFISAVQVIFEMMHDENIWHRTGEGKSGIELFENNRSLFTYSTLFILEGLRSMETDFGILPHPKLNEQQDNYYAHVSFADIPTIPITNKNLDYTGIIIEALAGKSAEIVVPAYYEIMLKTKIARDEGSEAMLDIIFNNRVMDLGDTIYTDIIRDGVFNRMMINNDRDLISKLERMQENVDKALDRTIEAFEALD